MPRLSKIGAAALAAFGWTSGANAVTASYLVVAGGGGGGTDDAGGGGAGGYLESSSASLDLTLSYTVTVGAGGAGGAYPSGGTGTTGNNSVFLLSTANGGGGGGGPATNSGVGVNGGSAGGGGGYNAASGGTATQGNSGGATGYGNNGGTGASGGAGRRWAGGGGGASAVGSNGGAQGSQGGNGGNGRASSITGTSVTYAGGGGGGSRDNSSTGGTGGGGAGGGQSVNGTAGTANLGAGGGGGGDNGAGASGGSGVVIISYASPQKFGGGIVTTSGANTIHTFQTSGTLSPLSSLSASYLIVAGGGSGGGGYFSGGGGAGGYRTGSGVIIDTNSTYLVTVGAGGAGASGNATNGNAGSSSVFISTTSAGGGYGQGYSNTGTGSGGSGGSGGGGGSNLGTTGGTGNTPSTSPSQGSNGGAGSDNGGGGGGGASAVGASGGASGGAGGAGTSNSISGSAVTYATGGDGKANSGGGVAGTANTGNGGQSAGSSGGTSGSGGSGIVIISYAGSVQLMAGGTVTISGGNVIHTFTSSGYLTPLKLVNNSLRFRSSNSAYLNRTPTTAGNRKTWTLSAWVKRGKLSSINTILNAGYSTIPWFVVNFGSDDTLQIAATAGSSASWKTAAVFRDPAAWYHIVAVVDTTSATTTITSTSTDRMRLYVNGVQYALTSGTVPTQNSDLQVNNTISHTIGGYSGEYFDGEMAEVNLIDGQALTPYSFGTYNSYGVWQPITYGGSYGTNGFYLPFTATQSYAGSFNGSSKYLTVPDNSVFSLGTNNFTVEGWFNSASFSAGQFVISQWNAASYGYAFSISNSTTIKFEYYSGATYYNRSYTVSALSTNTWYHIAWVRNSGTTTVYVNGVALTTTSDNNSIIDSTQPVYIGVNNDGLNQYWNGSISNLRFVNGTAVYTSNFIPQTTPLTAITNTSLLTLQNATIVDNSTNAFTITNYGSVATGGNYPFTILANTVKDFGPAGNNWTANNIGQINGSTLDTMTDVPTLTSATAANYCVLNPLLKGAGSIGTNYTITNGNLTFNGTAGAGNWAGGDGSIGVTTGKWYYECVYTSADSAGDLVAGWVMTQTPRHPGTGANSGAQADTGIGFTSGGGSIYTQGSGTGSCTSWTLNDVMGLAIDVDAKTATIYKNGTSIGTASGLNTGTYWAGIGGYQTYVCQINFGQRPFTYTPPSGYLALNTYNI